MMCRWTTHGHERLSRPGAQPRRGHLDGWFQHDGVVANWLGAFLPAWLAGPASRRDGGRRRADENAAAARPSSHDQGTRGESLIGAAI
jgi:hypothetical protein